MVNLPIITVLGGSF